MSFKDRVETFILLHRGTKIVTNLQLLPTLMHVYMDNFSTCRKNCPTSTIIDCNEK